MVMHAVSCHDCADVLVPSAWDGATWSGTPLLDALAELISHDSHWKFACAVEYTLRNCSTFAVVTGNPVSAVAPIETLPSHVDAPVCTPVELATHIVALDVPQLHVCAPVMSPAILSRATCTRGIVILAFEKVMNGATNAKKGRPGQKETQFL